MADNLKIRSGRVLLRTEDGRDADGMPRAFLAHPVKPGKLVYGNFGEAVRSTSRVLDENPHVVAQVRPLRRGTGTGVFAPLYAISVGRRAE